MSLCIYFIVSCIFLHIFMMILLRYQAELYPTIHSVVKHYLVVDLVSFICLLWGHLVNTYFERLLSTFWFTWAVELRKVSLQLVVWEPKMAFVVPEFPEDLYVPMLNLDPSTKGYFYVLLGDLHLTTPLQPQFIMLTGTDLWDLLARGPPLVFRATQPFYAAPPFVHQLLCFRGQN